MKLNMQGFITVCVDPMITKSLYDQGWRVICFTEDKQYQSVMPEAMMGSIFLPPYDAMDPLLDGQMEVFSSIYYDYLFNSQDVSLMTSIVLAALYTGVRLVIFVPQQEFELNFFQYFADYLLKSTGVLIGNTPDSCRFDYKYNNINLIRLYDAGYIQLQDIMTYHDGPFTSPEAPMMICHELGYYPADGVTAMEYINKYKANIDSAGRFLQKGLIRV